MVCRTFKFALEELGAVLEDIPHWTYKCYIYGMGYDSLEFKGYQGEIIHRNFVDLEDLLLTLKSILACDFLSERPLLFLVVEPIIAFRNIRHDVASILAKGVANQAPFDECSAEMTNICLHQFDDAIVTSMTDNPSSEILVGFALKDSLRSPSFLSVHPWKLSCSRSPHDACLDQRTRINRRIAEWRRRDKLETTHRDGAPHSVVPRAPDSSNTMLDASDADWDGDDGELGSDKGFEASPIRLRFGAE